MIPVHQLRPGNQVREKYDPQSVITIDTVARNEFSYDRSYVIDRYADEYPIDEIEPIPLTVEIIKNWFGFTKYAGYMAPDRYRKDYTHVLVTTTFELQEIDTGLFMWIAGNYIVHIRYVHELQNLWHSLTSTELERNPLPQ